MSRLRSRDRTYTVATATVVLALGPVSANSAAFQLLEQGAKGQGTSYAGTAVQWEDTATAFWNPAGIVRHQERSATVVGSVIDVRFDFSDDGSTLGGTSPGGNQPDFTFDQTPGAEATESADAGESAFVPSFHYIHPVANNLAFGFAINVPYGLESDYDPEWVGRYHAVNSELTTINFNPSVSYRLSPAVSIGAGLNVQHLEATLTSRLDPTAAGTAIAGSDFGSTRGDPDDDSDVEIDGDNWSAGINLGVLADISERSRLGIAYRGHVTHSVDGDVSYNHRNQAFANFTAAQNIFVDAGAQTTLDLPESLTISYSRAPALFGPQNPVTILGDLTWTRWNRIDSLDISFDSDQPDTSERLDFDNTLRFALAAVWAINPTWQLRTGLAYDESPVQDASTRSPRVPDNDRRWFSIGAGYSPPESDFHIDAGLSLISVSDTLIERSNEFGDVLRGDYNSAVTVFALEGSWRF